MNSAAAIGQNHETRSFGELFFALAALTSPLWYGYLPLIVCAKLFGFMASALVVFAAQIALFFPIMIFGHLPLHALARRSRSLAWLLIKEDSPDTYAESLVMIFLYLNIVNELFVILPIVIVGMGIIINDPTNY